MQFLLIIVHDETFVPTEGLVKKMFSWIASVVGQGEHVILDLPTI
jgi:hypothetical protein